MGKFLKQKTPIRKLVEILCDLKRLPGIFTQSWIAVPEWYCEHGVEIKNINKHKGLCDVLVLIWCLPGDVKVQASVARCLRTPPYAARHKDLSFSD